MKFSLIFAKANPVASSEPLSASLVVALGMNSNDIKTVTLYNFDTKKCHTVEVGELTFDPSTLFYVPGGPLTKLVPGILAARLQLPNFRRSNLNEKPVVVVTVPETKVSLLSFLFPS